MKAILLCLALFSGFVVFAQPAKPAFNQKLADSLGADDYGMKMYVLIILKSGSKPENDKAKRDALFKGHMANINKMADSGTLVLAGPMAENSAQYSGIFVLDVKTIDEAKKRLQEDPAVASGHFDAEYFQWYGSAALGMYLPYHRAIERKKP